MQVRRWWIRCAIVALAAAGCNATSFWVPVGSTADRFAISGFDQDASGFVVVGQSRAVPSDYQERLYKLDGSGHTLWFVNLDALDPWGLADGKVRTLPGGGYLVCGHAEEGYPSANERLVLAELDSTGDPVWTTRFAENELWSPSCSSIHVTADGYAAFYWGYSLPANDTNPHLLLRTDAAGTPLATVELEPDLSGGMSGIVTSDGGFAYVKDVESTQPLPSPPDHDPVLVKLDPLGQPVWQRTYTRDLLEERAGSIQQTSDGGFVLAGQDLPYYPDQNNQVWVRKTDSGGNEEWVNDVANDVSSKGGSAVENGTSGYVVRANRNGGTQQAFPELLSLDSAGQVQSMTIFGAPSCHVDGSSLKRTTDGGFVFHASAYPPSSSFPHYLVKTDSALTAVPPPADCT